MTTCREVGREARTVGGGEGARVVDAPFRLIDERLVERPMAAEAKPRPNGFAAFLLALAVLPLKFVLMLVRMAFSAGLLLGLVGGAIFLLTYALVQFDGSLRWAAGCGVLAFVSYVGAFLAGYIEALIERAVAPRA